MMRLASSRLEQARSETDSIYVKSAIALTSVAALGGGFYAIARPSVVSEPQGFLDWVYAVAMVIGCASLVAALVLLYLSIRPSKYFGRPTLSSIVTEWNKTIQIESCDEREQRWRKVVGSVIEKTEMVESHTVAVNECRRSRFMWSVRMLGLAVGMLFLSGIIERAIWSI